MSKGENQFDLDNIYKLIDNLFYEGIINQCTLQVLSDILDVFFKPYPKTQEEFHYQLNEEYQIDLSLESLKDYLKREFKGWQEEHESPDELLEERFNICTDGDYSSVKEFLDKANYEIILGVLKGDINLDNAYSSE